MKAYAVDFILTEAAMDAYGGGLANALVSIASFMFLVTAMTYLYTTIGSIKSASNLRWTEAVEHARMALLVGLVSTFTYSLVPDLPDELREDLSREQAIEFTDDEWGRFDNIRDEGFLVLESGASVRRQDENYYFSSLAQADYDLLMGESE